LVYTKKNIRINILHIIGSLNTGGVQKLILQLSQSQCLKKYTHNVLCTILSVDNYRYAYEKYNITILSLPFKFAPISSIPFKLDKIIRYLFSKLYFFRLWYYLFISEFEVIHTHIHSQIISQILASVLSGKRMIWTIHGEYSMGRFTLWIIRILFSILPSTKFQIIADSISALHSTLPFTGNNFKPDNIIPTGINLKPYFQEYDQSLIREKYNIKDDTILIGSTGRIVWEKGYDQLLSLLENYDFGEKIFYILVAGDGSLRNKFIKRIEKNKLESHITFIGNIKNIPEFLSALDIYIQPSVTEGFPLSVLEAMATGLPIICSDAGGLKEMINNNTIGIKYKSEELNSLYQMLCKLLSMKPNKLLELGRNARKEVVKKYSIEIIAKQYYKIY